MTLAEQFPDISMFVREKKKLNMKTDAIPFLQDRNYTPPISTDQKFYDREFRIFHYKLLAFISVMLSSLFFLILNGQGIWNWIISQRY